MLLAVVDFLLPGKQRDASSPPGHVGSRRGTRVLWVQGWAGGRGQRPPAVWAHGASPGPSPATPGDTLATAPLPGTVPCKAAPDAGARDGSLPSVGSLIQVPMSEKGKITRGRLGSLSLRKEGERQCFLFSKHLIICTRGSGGKLHLTKVRRAGGARQPPAKGPAAAGLGAGAASRGARARGPARGGAEAGTAAARAGWALWVTPGVQGPPRPPLAAASRGGQAGSRRSVGFIPRGPDTLSVMCRALSHGQRGEIARSR